MLSMSKMVRWCIGHLGRSGPKEVHLRINMLRRMKMLIWLSSSIFVYVLIFPYA